MILRVLLTAPPFAEADPWGKIIQEQVRVCPKQALYLLAAVLEKHGQQVTLIDPLDFEAHFRSPDLIAQSVSGIDLLGISIDASAWPRARRLLSNLEDLSRRPVTVLGGPHASGLDGYLARTTAVDYLIRGEGEKSFPLLLDFLQAGKDPALVPGITFRRGEELIQTPPGPLLTPEELAELPLPKFELMPKGYYELLPIETSRGCFYACIFCSIGFQRNWRGIPPGQVADRIGRLAPYLDRTTQKCIFIVDDCFTADHPRLIQIADQLSGLDLRLVFLARITDLLAPGMLEAIARLPVEVMEMGVESGYEEGLQRVGKKLLLEQVKQAGQLLEKSGIRRQARFSFILGLPWEKKREIFRTLEFAFKLTHRLQSRLIVNFLTVFPGSLIWQKRRDWGIQITEQDYDQERWWLDQDIFRKCHPRLNIPTDLEHTLTYIKVLMNYFPDIRHDGVLKWL
jgi:radical SAM superfamily enzyme YgiQ (UPF0313 family)